MDVVFLDANVLFSAAYRRDNRLLHLWHLQRKKRLRLISSRYAAEEARRNLARPEYERRLDRLLRNLRLVESLPALLPHQEHFPHDLPAKDRPILAAAIAAGASHLLTGDIKHFGSYFGQEIGGVLVLAPARYLQGLMGEEISATAGHAVDGSL